MRCKKAWIYPALGALLFVLGVGCGGGGGSGGAAVVSPETTSFAGGWVEILTPTAEAQYTTVCPDLYVAGEAFISDDLFRCCSGSAEDTAVTVRWENRSTGDAGSAAQTVNVCYLFGTPFLCDHFWSATIPLQEGDNVIRLRAEEAAGGTGWGIDTLTVTKPGPSYAATGTLFTAAGFPLGNRETDIEIVLRGNGLTHKGIPGVDGRFQIICLPDGVYELTLETPLSYVFTPESFHVMIDGGDVSGLDFTTEAYFVSGTVLYASTGAPVPNLHVEISDGRESFSTATDGQGQYRLAVPNGSYTVTPFFLIANDPLDFFPPSLALTVNGSDVAQIDFQYTP